MTYRRRSRTGYRRSSSRRHVEHTSKIDGVPRRAVDEHRRADDRDAVDEVAELERVRARHALKAARGRRA